MPMSKEAAAGLRAAVAWNPHAARYLMHILRDMPIAVKYKEQDRYGPLSMMLHAGPHLRWITKDVSIPVQPAPFPEERLKDCEVFNAEWLQRRFSLQELADAIEEILAEVEPAPLLADAEPNTFLVLRPDGTFLQTSDNNHFKQ